MTRRKKIIAGGSVLIVIFIALLIWGFGMNGFRLDQRTQKQDVKDSDMLRQQIQQNADESQFQIRINGQLVLEEEKDEVKLYLRNPEENSYETYVELISDQTGTIIYTSPKLKPGESVEQAQMEIVPEKGTNPYTARFHILDGSKEISAVDYGITVERKK